MLCSFGSWFSWFILRTPSVAIVFCHGPRSAVNIYQGFHWVKMPSKFHRPGRVGSGRVGSDQEVVLAMSRVESGQVGSAGVRKNAPVGSGHTDPARPASSDPSRENPCRRTRRKNAHLSGLDRTVPEEYIPAEGALVEVPEHVYKAPDSKKRNSGSSGEGESKGSADGRHQAHACLLELKLSGCREACFVWRCVLSGLDGWQLPVWVRTQNTSILAHSYQQFYIFIPSCELIISSKPTNVDACYIRWRCTAFFLKFFPCLRSYILFT